MSGVANLQSTQPISKGKGEDQKELMGKHVSKLRRGTGFDWHTEHIPQFIIEEQMKEQAVGTACVTAATRSVWKGDAGGDGECSIVRNIKNYISSQIYQMALSDAHEVDKYLFADSK